MKRIVFLLISVFLFSSVSVQAKVEKKDRLWQDESIYSIMIDRFSDGDTKNDLDVNAKDPLAYNGGDFQGIINQLDYIKGMGYTAIRLTPIFDNARKGYHGYWVNDFYKVDEHFGSMKTFQKLVKEAHKRKMRVLVDFVTNNTAKNHPWVSDPGKQEWFHSKRDITDWNNQQEVESGWVHGFPDLNQENPEVGDYLINAAKWWIMQTDIDGYSLPEVNHVPVSFWRDFSEAVKREKKDFFLLGVMSENRSIDVEEYQRAGIDSVWDYTYSADLREVFANTDRSFAPIFAKNNKQSPIKAPFLDNEFTVRFTKDIVDERQFPGARWKTALTYLYTTPGIPVVYYGTEIALTGGDIPDNRRQMNFRTEKELIDYITKLGKLRNQLPSLTRGTLEVLYDQKGMAVYKRVYKGETSIIAINNTRKTQKVTLTSDQVEGGKELRGLLGGDLVRSQHNKYVLIQDRDNSEIYVLTEKSGLNLPLIGSLLAVALLVLVFLVMIIKRSKTNKVE